MTERTYGVAGMTCDHCAGFVTEALEELPGVTAVAVDVDGGTVTVTSEGGLAEADVSAAVEETGYAFTGARE